MFVIVVVVLQLGNNKHSSLRQQLSVVRKQFPRSQLPECGYMLRNVVRPSPNPGHVCGRM